MANRHYISSKSLNRTSVKGGIYHPTKMHYIATCPVCKQVAKIAYDIMRDGYICSSCKVMVKK